MEEKKVYDIGDVETLYDELWEMLDYDVLEERLAEKGLGDYSLDFSEVMAGGSPEDKVCTPEFCKKFCEGMLEIKKELSK